MEDLWQYCSFSNYSAVIRSSPLASGFLSFLTIPIGISEAALSQDIDKVRGQQKLDFRMTMSFVSDAIRLRSPLPSITKDVSSTIISILIRALFFCNWRRNSWSKWLQPLFDPTPMIQSPLSERSFSRVISMLFLWFDRTLWCPRNITSSWAKVLAHGLVQIKPNAFTLR